jgi:hypothetical protein
MKLLTRKILAQTAPARWRNQYANSSNDWHREVTDELDALSTPISATKVDKIIGNKTWTAVPKCDECGSSEVGAVVELGEEVMYESNTACICCGCLKKALDLFPKP